MKLIEHPGRVLRRAWSMWLAYLAIVLAVAEAMHPELLALLPALQGVLGERTFALASMIVTVLIPAARVIDQGMKAADEKMKNMEGPAN